MSRKNLREYVIIALLAIAVAALCALGIWLDVLWIRFWSSP